MTPLLEFRKVTVHRGAAPALSAIDLEIGVGEHVAILGPNGSGKSTLIRTITREFYPARDPGTSLRLLGRECWNIFELRSHLGIVTPDLLLRAPAEVTVRDAVLSGFHASDGIWWGHQTVTPAMQEAAAAALGRLEATTIADRPIHQLSSGELRRVQIARALVHAPATLLLDEPSTHLDLFGQWELRRSLRALAQGGTGLLLVTHHLADIIPEVERVILLKEGRIVGDGPKQELLRAERLGELFGVRVEMVERDGYYHAW